MTSTLLTCVVAMAAASGENAAAGQRGPTSVPAVSDVSSRLPLSIKVFNPGESAIFAVSSVLVEGNEDAILIDAQFSADQARTLVDKIKSSGKRLTTIYVSHGDPDYYFGLDTLHAAFPDAEILATPLTIAHIQATKDEKLKTWGPTLGRNAPARIIVPQPLEGDTLTLEGQNLDIVGLNGPTPDRTFVWIPSIRTIAGGVAVFAGEHVWMADTQTPESHERWLATLDRIEALHPVTVIPGHFVGRAPLDLRAVYFTSDYIRTFGRETAKAKNSADLVASMKRHYPGLGGESSLDLSAKVAKGEMKWN